MQQQYTQKIDLSNTPTMEEVLNGRHRLGQRTFFSSDNILRENPSSNKREKIYREPRLSTQQLTLQTFQWLSPEISQEHRPGENFIKFENEPSIISMDEIYKSSDSRNNVDDLSKKLYTVPYSFHHNTLPEEHQFSENQFPCLENDIQSTLCIDESDVADISKEHMTTTFPISINERNTESKVLANNIKLTNKTGIFDSEYRIKKEKITEKQQRSVKESLAAESLMTLQISKDDDDFLSSSKDQMKKNKQNKKRVQNQIDKENDQNFNAKSTINDQILYDMIVRSGLTMENVLKFKEDHYKNSKNDIRTTVLQPAMIPLQNQPSTTVNIPVQLQEPVPVPNPFQSPAQIVNSMQVVKLPKAKPANMSGYRTRPVPILPATNLPYHHPYLIQGEIGINTEMNGILLEKPQRPSYSYASMIGQAIMASEEKKLALADIYSWISKTYPYYKMSDIGWKNSIRHNLSLYSAFIRVPNEGTTRSLWMINPDEEQCFINGVYHYSKRPPGSNKSLRRKYKSAPKPINDNSNNVNNVQTEISQVPAYLTTNDTIMPMVTSLPYCSMHPEAQYFSTYELPKGEASSEQSY
ncbi:8083_t:CDS:2, partial [Funneliformis geosporum]